MTGKWLGVPVLFVALLKFCELPVSGQGVADQSPDDERAQLHISAPGSIFRQGELIPLTLSFASKIPDRYQVNMATYDRSGRMGYEQFLVEPTKGTSDPLALYFNSALIHMTGGLTNFKFLSDTPYIVHLDLNEWVRFDAPGHYRIVVASRRVSDVGSKSKTLYDNSFYQGTIQHLKSNPIDIEIVAPDFAWQQEQLREILLDLDKSPQEPGPFLTGFKSGALRRLRYLGSEDAARELARHMNGIQNAVEWNCMFGLIGSPNRMAGLAEMKRLIGVPDFPVTGLFLNTMAIIPLDPDNSVENLRHQKEANLAQARSLLLRDLSLKKGEALVESVDTMLQNLDPSISQADRDKLVSLLIEHFDLLKIEEQRTWLEDKWPTVKSAQWLPTLRGIAAKYADYPIPNAPNVLPTYNYFKLSGDGLIRWYELDPEGARPSVIAEIVRLKPRYSANTLGMLPDKVLPNEERAIADHFLAAEGDAVEGNLASLLNRYADAAVLPQVLPKITKKLDGLWACITENNAVAYVQKVDPEAAKPLIERVTSGCQRFPLRPDLP